MTKSSKDYFFNGIDGFKGLYLVSFNTVDLAESVELLSDEVTEIDRDKSNCISLGF